MKAIDCPLDCVWLGGLAVVRDPTRAPVPNRQACLRALGKLHAYSDTAKCAHIVNEALDLVFVDGRPEAVGWEAPLVVAFVCYGHRSSNGQRLIDQFLAARAQDLTPEEIAVLLAHQRARAGLFEVVEIHAGMGLNLRDLVSGETLHIKEVSATTQLRRWDAIFTWIVQHGNQLVLTGAVFVVSRPHVSVVLDALTTALTQARRRRPGVADRELMGEIAWAPIRALREAYRNVRMPQLRNMHGNEVIFCKARYRFADGDDVRSRLGALPDMDPTGDGFMWLDDEGHPALGDGPLALGWIRISADRLILEVNSRERLWRGKRLIQTVLEGLVEHEGDSIQDIESAMREYRDKSKPIDEQKPSHNGIPEERRREIVGRHLQEHYRRWIDRPLPALGGKSPREAAKTPSGRVRVDDLLKEAENLAARIEGGGAVDFNALRRDIGLLEEPLDVCRQYDAAIAPDPATWLTTDDHEKAAAVERHHEALSSHPEMPRVHLHALMHVIVENQLAAGDPKEVVATLERLMAGGLSRHEAIHAIGSVVAEELNRILQENRPFDERAVAQSLSRLRPFQWAGSVTP